jgi:hypothetical protein
LHVFRRLPGDGRLLHHEPDVVDDRRIARGVAVDGDEIGQQTWIDVAPERFAIRVQNEEILAKNPPVVRSVWEGPRPDRQLA